MRYRHANIWRDDEVVCLHCVGDKPWEARVGSDGLAGLKGLNGVTHGWWWGGYLGWEREQEGGDPGEVLEIVRGYVASEKGDRGSDEGVISIGITEQDLDSGRVTERCEMNDAKVQGDLPGEAA